MSSTRVREPVQPSVAKWPIKTTLSSMTHSKKQPSRSKPAPSKPANPGRARSPVVRRPSGSNPVVISKLRLFAIERLIEERHCQWHPDDTECETYLRAATPHLAAIARAKGKEQAGLLQWVRRQLPEYTISSSELEYADQIAMDDVSRLPTADEFADIIWITADEVKDLKLKAVGSIDRRKEQRQAERKVSERKRFERKRRSEGMRPREEYLANTIKAQHPRLPGESKSAYYRRIKQLREAQEEIRLAA